MHCMELQRNRLPRYVMKPQMFPQTIELGRRSLPLLRSVTEDIQAA